MLGLDLLGLGNKHWDMDGTKKVFPQGWALGCFDGTLGNSKFGDAYAHVRDLLQTGKVAALRVQMAYYVDHHFVTEAELRKRLPVWERVAKDFPAIPVYVSPSTEHNVRDVATLQKTFALMKRLAPSVTPINNPWQGVTVPGVLTETHNPSVRADLFSDDGKSCTDSNIVRVNRQQRHATIRLMWASRFNLRESSDRLPPPEARTASPDARYLQAVIRLATAKGAAPAPNFKGRFNPVKAPLLWKAFAEDKEGVDVRANKPLFICPLHATYLYVVDCNGKDVSKLKMFGNYPPNLHRFYSGTGSNLYGYQMARLAAKQSGSEFVWITADRKTYYGPINPAFREGSFR